MEPVEYSALKTWLHQHGGSFHDDVQFRYAENTGHTAVASKDIPVDATIVSCPFSLVITEELVKRNLSRLFFTDDITGWTERQWIGTYICLHWILSNSEPPGLEHYPYINTLPPSDQLRTSLHFTETELKAFEGSNIYQATIDREREWREEWLKCQSVLTSKNNIWGECFTWARYLTAATHISSRAFPSSILSSNPTLKTTPETKPILLPGVDSLNHKRAQRVSWSVTFPEASGPTSTSSVTGPTISLVLHAETFSGEELFNNYGPKPNAELILGYGFSLPANPDDTILLKIRGFERRWEIGRSAQGADSLWGEFLDILKQGQGVDEEEREEYEVQMDAADMLANMAETLLRRLPSETVSEERGLRPEVATMLRDYIEGQRAILTSLLGFCTQKEEGAVDLARSLGVDLIIED